jgi:hypothetical protein
VQLHAEVVGVELPLHAEAVRVELPLHAEAAGVELPRRAEVAVVAPRRAEAAGVAAPPHAEAVGAELTRHAEAVAELPRRAEAAYAPRGQVTVRQEACDCREASRCSLQGRLLRPRRPATAHREAHACPEWQGRFSHLVVSARCWSLRRRRHRHGGFADRSRQPAYPDARRQRRHRSIAPGVW